MRAISPSTVKFDLTASPGRGLCRQKGILLWVAKPAPLAGKFRGLANEHPTAKTGGASPLQTRDRHGIHRANVLILGGILMNSQPTVPQNVAAEEAVLGALFLDPQ